MRTRARRVAFRDHLVDRCNTFRGNRMQVQLLLCSLLLYSLLLVLHRRKPHKVKPRAFCSRRHLTPAQLFLGVSVSVTSSPTRVLVVSWIHTTSAQVEVRRFLRLCWNVCMLLLRQRRAAGGPSERERERVL